MHRAAIGLEGAIAPNFSSIGIENIINVVLSAFLI